MEEVEKKLLIFLCFECFKIKRNCGKMVEGWKSCCGFREGKEHFSWILMSGARSCYES